VLESLYVYVYVPEVCVLPDSDDGRVETTEVKSVRPRPDWKPKTETKTATFCSRDQDCGLNAIFLFIIKCCVPVCELPGSVMWNMALLPTDASDVPKSKKPGMRMEKCLFGQQELDVPEIMMEDVRFIVTSCVVSNFSFIHSLFHYFFWHCFWWFCILYRKYARPVPHCGFL